MSPTDLFDLSDKTAVVTGAGQGIGLAIAQAFSKFGANLVLADLDQAKAATAAEGMQSDGREALAIQADVRSVEDVEQIFDQTVQRFDRVDVLVNNAAGSFPADFFDLTGNGWDAIVRATMKSVFLCSQAAAKIMVKQKSGNIINISSMDAFCAVPHLIPYAAAKAAVVSLTKSLAYDLGPEIRVNSIAPGIIKTPGIEGWSTPEEEAERIKRIPLNRLGIAEDISPVAVFLAADASRYITGETIVADGGALLRA